MSTMDLLYFIKTVPLVVENGQIKPEIRISKDTVLILEYPINVYSPSKGLTHKGEGGHFTYRFKKDRVEYRILFTKRELIFDRMDKKYSVSFRWYFSYMRIWQVIKQCNEDKSLLF